MLAQQFNGDFTDISDKDLEDTVSEKRDRQRKYKRGTKWLSSVSGLEEEQLKLILFQKGRLRPFYRRQFEQLFTDYQEWSQQSCLHGLWLLKSYAAIFITSQQLKRNIPILEENLK